MSLQKKKRGDFRKGSHPDFAINIKLGKIEAEIKSLIDKLPEANDTLFKYINEHVTELDKEKREVEADISAKQLSAADTDILRLSELWDKGDFDNKRLIAQSLIADVKIIDDKINIEWRI